MKPATPGPATGLIPRFETINAFLAAIQSRHRTPNDDLFCLRVEDTFPHTVDVMPPFRKGFYFVSLITDAGDTQIGYDGNRATQMTAFLVFQSPGHVYSWHRDRHVRGYLIYFRKDVFRFFRPDFDAEFPFFSVLHTNFFAIRQVHFDQFAPMFEDVFAAYERFPRPADPPVAALKLLAVLYPLRTFVADINRYETHYATPEQQLVRQFTQLVTNYYVDKRTVEEYAHLLHVTPQHLSETVRAVTNQSALHLINQKLLDEAKILLRYTPGDVAEVAYALNFSDPANFGRFFKKHTGQTPLTYRKAGNS